MVKWIWLCVVGRVACLSARRPYLHVPYGESAPAGVVSISVDGKVPGTSLDLTHWTNNETPEAFYADTSTEIAVNFARAAAERGEGDVFERLHLDHEAALQNNMMEQARVAEETAHRQAFRARPAREHGAARLHAWGDTEEGRTK